MFGDDKVTYPLPTSFYVKYLLTAGADNLMAVRSTLVANESDTDVQLTLHSFAPYTLVRTTIECAATAIWIMAPTSRTERVFRAAVVELDDAWKSLQAFQSMSLDGTAIHSAGTNSRDPVSIRLLRSGNRRPNGVGQLQTAGCKHVTGIGQGADGG
jgi:hypothetical protein